MLKLLKSIFLGLVLFGLAGAASWFWMNYQPPAADNDTATDAPVRDEASAEGSRRLSDVPVPVRPPTATAEEIFRLAAALRKQQEALIQREEALEQERAQLKLVHEDVRNQQRELEGVLAQIHESLKAGDAVLAKILQERQQLEQERSAAGQQLQQIQEANLKQNDFEEAGLKKNSRIVEELSRDVSAAYLRELIDAGKIETAVRLLSNMKERDVAEILIAIRDPVLMAQLMEGMQNVKRPQPTKRR